VAKSFIMMLLGC